MANIIDVYNIIGRGIVIVTEYGDYHVGEEFEFHITPLGMKCKATIKGVEIGCNKKFVGLCFGAQFNDEIMQFIKSGQFRFHKAHNDVFFSDFQSLTKDEKIETLLKYLNTPIAKRKLQSRKIEYMINDLYKEFNLN